MSDLKIEVESKELTLAALVYREFIKTSMHKFYA